MSAVLSVPPELHPVGVSLRRHETPRNPAHRAKQAMDTIVHTLLPRVF